MVEPFIAISYLDEIGNDSFIQSILKLSIKCVPDTILGSGDMAMTSKMQALLLSQQPREKVCQ